MRRYVFGFTLLLSACAAPHGASTLPAALAPARAVGAAPRDVYWVMFSRTGQPVVEYAAAPLSPTSIVHQVNGNTHNMLRNACCIRFYQNLAWILTAPGGSGSPDELLIFSLPLKSSDRPLYYDKLEGSQFAVHMEFDGHGNLWVSSLGQSRKNSSVSEYSADFFLEAGDITPALTLTAGLNGPQGLGFDLNGNLYVANGQTSQIAVFAQPIQNRQPYYLDGVDDPGALAFDAHGNLFAASNDGSTGSIVEYRSTDLHSGDKPNVVDPTGIDASPYGSDLGFDKAGNLYDGDCGNTAGIYTYPLATKKFTSHLAPSFYTNSVIAQFGCVWGLAIR
jgi:hypothetical protein